MRTLKKLITPQRYTNQVKAAKVEILSLVRKRVVAETRHAVVWGSVEAKKMAVFLEQFM